MKNPETSIIILTRNAGNYFEKILTQIFSQNYKNFEVIIIDTNSTDNTLEIAKKYPVKIKKIKEEEFGHGKTRNLGAKLARGKYVVYLTHDAMPKDDNWLSELVKPLKEKKIAGVFSRQIPKKNENTIEKFFYYSLYPEQSKVWNWDNSKQGNNIFSDVSSAIKKEILVKYPFDDKIIVTEDYEWAFKVLKKSYSVMYNAKSKVIHSHSYTLRQLVKRNFDIGVSYLTIYTSKEKRGGFLSNGMKIMWNEMKFLMKNKKIYLIPYALLKDVTKFVFVKVGMLSRHLPNSLNKKLSNYQRYWK